MTTASVAIQIRSNIARWVRKQSCVKLKNLKENKQFAVRVTNVAKSDIISAAIRCSACNTTIYLLQKNKSIKSSPYFISNWTRHVKMCPKLDKKQDSVQQSLVVFFLHPLIIFLIVLATAPIALALLIGPAFNLPPSTHILIALAHIYPPTPSTSDRSDLPSTSQNSDHRIVDKSLPGDQYYSIDDSQPLSSDPLTLHSENHQVFLNAPLSAPSPQ